MKTLDFAVLVPKIDALLARGLSHGLGTQGGQVCVEAAICEVLGLPHGDAAYAYAAYAYAAYAYAYAYAAAAAAKRSGDKYLLLSAKLALECLVELKAPGVAFL